MVERSIRPIALYRKNVLFADTGGGAEHWAVIASLIETCKLNGVEQLGYLAGLSTGSSTAAQQPHRRPAALGLHPDPRA
ncbi:MULTISPECIES: transposase [unclassified Mesorhizobium]|uniref:transposase n=1 Tax=unclassified Mesorhizobium TaxID=325217 RepID=UPI0033394F50